MKKRASLKFLIASFLFYLATVFIFPNISGLTEDVTGFLVGLGVVMAGSMLVLALYMLALSRLHKVTADGQKIGVYNSHAEVKMISVSDILSVGAVPLFPAKGGRNGAKAYAESWPAWNPMLRIQLSEGRLYYLPITRHNREQEIVLRLLRTLHQRGIKIDIAVKYYLEGLGVPAPDLRFTNVIGSPAFTDRKKLKKTMTTQGLVLLVALGVLLLLGWFAYDNPDGWLAKVFAVIERWSR